MWALSSVSWHTHQTAIHCKEGETLQQSEDELPPPNSGVPSTKRRTAEATKPCPQLFACTIFSITRSVPYAAGELRIIYHHRPERKMSLQWENLAPSTNALSGSTLRLPPIALQSVTIIYKHSALIKSGFLCLQLLTGWTIFL